MRRLDCHNRIKQVQRSYHTALQTVDYAALQPQYLHAHDFTLAEMRALAEELHDVYFVHMFACFESILRHYWRREVRDTRPITEQLIRSIAARRGVPEDALAAVDEIRVSRNHLVHEEQDDNHATRTPINDASRHLNTYIARLPLEW
jgi:hypothetical protein